MSEKRESGDIATEEKLETTANEAVEKAIEQRVAPEVTNIKSTSENLRENAMNSYMKEWETYFTQHKNDEQLLKSLKSRAFKESLRSCCFRSICWRVFLGCLPASVDQWPDSLRQSREAYHAIKTKHVTNPYVEAEGKDLQLENPLSQNDRSCWSQYFKNNELKNLIERDVKRTWPEMDFFHSNDIQNLMASVLFCYAREHEALSYRQGMHELLAPLLFVLHCDLQGAAHAKEIGKLPDTLCRILDEVYLEHDVYSMFCQVMDATNPWYSVTGKKSDSDEDVKQQPLRTVPFQSPESAVSSPPLAITNKLSRIHSKLLAEHDVALFQHLNRLEIIPQVYGLRWVRLLFGREFDLQDLLVLWDALFADSKSLDLVDYIFVAMMFNIRVELLNGDYCQCMQLLMKYPPIEDIYDLVHLAMHYRDPKKYKKPIKIQRKASGGAQPTTIILPNSTANQSKKLFPNFKLDNPFSSLRKSFKSSPPRTKRTVTANAPSVNEASVRYTSPPRSEGEEQKTIASSKIEQRLRSLSGLDSMKIKKSEEEILQNHIEALKQQVSNLEEKCLFCSDKIEASIRLLQAHIVKQSVKENDPTTSSAEDGDGSNTKIKNEEQLVALANLKQVRDMLRGTLSYLEKKPKSHSFDRTEDASKFQSSSVPDDWAVLERPHMAT